MLVCIWIVIFCIGVLKERENETDTDAKSFISSIEYAANESTVFNNEQKSFDNESESIDKVSDDFDNGWNLTLVNKWHPLPEKLEIETVELSNGECVDKRIYPYLQKMFDDARAEGIYPIVRSGYRTRTEQEDIYNDRIQGYQADGMSAEEAKTETELWVAVPGTSEHELGLAVDINADKVHSEGAQVYAWLENHAHLYGFINRYPPDKTEITGVANEPWHYRYVGVEAASEIHERGICLEEYLENDGN
ncbi:MAG: M15 family metallopeptidase [Lachnospiraceae bacterium]|nr:M15 family metallopeptidase [Lachnospiraceae bacterium]